MPNPFDFIKSINEKNHIMDSFSEPDYVPFLVNRGFSLFPDTIAFANRMNLNSNLDNAMQYDYLYHSIGKKKRFKKWPQKTKVNSTNIDLISQKYKYSVSKTKTALSVLTEKQIDIIKKQQEKGGT